MMDILTSIWEKYGKYATKEGVRHFWKKEKILPMEWYININNEWGGEYLLNKDRTTSKEKFNEL